MDADAAGAISIPAASTPVLTAATNIDPNPIKGIGDTIHTSDNAILAYTGPSGTIADVPTSVQNDRISVYVVRSGDTLSEIASMFNISKNTIIWANNLKSQTNIHVGDTLLILPVSGTEHIVTKSDTLKSIAKQYNANTDEIAQFNGLDSSVALEVGSTIIIPGGEMAISTSAKSNAAARGSSKQSSDTYEPYLGGSGTAQSGYYTNPVPSGIITQRVHGWNAVDIGASLGTPIYAAADGIVIIARNNDAWNGGYGNYAVISHENGTQTLYGHMANITVTSGQSVSKGQPIGAVGSTGMSTGAHLHFEVRGAANPLRKCKLSSACMAQ